MSGGSTDANEKWQVSSHRDLCKTTSSWEKISYFLKTSSSVKTKQNFPTVFDLHVLSSSGSDGI